MKSDEAISAAQSSFQQPHLHSSSASGDCFKRIRLWVRQRNLQGAATYPDPIDRFFRKLDVCQIFVAFTLLLVAIESVNLDEAIKRQANAILICSTFSLTAAHHLQDLIPEIALPALLIGFSLLITSFMILVMQSLHIWLGFVVIKLYFLLLLPVLYKICKEGIFSNKDGQICKYSTAFRKSFEG